jgi:hypothetical protein
VHVEIERLLTHGNQKDGMPGLSHVLLGDLQFDRLAGLFKLAKQRGRGLAHLEIDGAVLDLDDDVVVEFAVELLEIVISRAGPIVLGVAPVHVVVVDKAAVKEKTAVRLERASHRVGGIRVRSSVGRRAHTALGIRLQNEAGQVGNGAVDLVGFRFPPRGHARVERVEGIQTAHGLGDSEIHRQRHLDAPGTESRGDARHLRDEVRRQDARVGVDVVDGATIDAERGQQAGVLAGAGEVRARVVVLPENGAAAIAALDRAIQIVPLVDPPYRSEGRLLLIEVAHRLAQSDLPQKRECAVQNPAIIGRGDDGVAGGAVPQGLEPIPVRLQLGGGIELRKSPAYRSQAARPVSAGRLVAAANTKSAHSFTGIAFLPRSTTCVIGFIVQQFPAPSGSQETVKAAVGVGHDTAKWGVSALAGS